jgi:hypothetical protein
VSTDEPHIIIFGSRDTTTVRLPLLSRDALIDRLRSENMPESMVGPIAAAESGQGVRLDPREKRDLLDVCKRWLSEAHVTGLPPGIMDLRNELLNEKAYGTLDE